MHLDVLYCSETQDQVMEARAAVRGLRLEVDRDLGGLLARVHAVEERVGKAEEDKEALGAGLTR